MWKSKEENKGPLGEDTVSEEILNLLKFESFDIFVGKNIRKWAAYDTIHSEPMKIDNKDRYLPFSLLKLFISVIFGVQK